MLLSASALLLPLAFAPPAVDAAPACTHRHRVALTSPYSPVPTELRNTQLLFTAAIFGSGVGTNIGVLDTKTAAVAWLTTFTQAVEQRPVFLTNDIVVYQILPASQVHEMHAIWFGPDGLPGTADDATWMFESGTGYVSFPDANDDEVAWIVTDSTTGLSDLHRCDWRAGTAAPCVPGGVAVLPLPTAPFEARRPYPIGGSDVLISRHGSSAVSWVDPAGTMLPWRTTSFVDAVGPFVATWRNPPGVTEVELATNPPGVPWASLPVTNARFSHAFGSNGHARAIGAKPGGFIGHAVVVDFDFGGYTTQPSTYPLAYGAVVEGDRVAYVTSTPAGNEIEVEDCYFP